MTAFLYQRSSTTLLHTRESGRLAGSWCTAHAGSPPPSEELIRPRDSACYDPRTHGTLFPARYPGPRAHRWAVRLVLRRAQLRQPAELPDLRRGAGYGRDVPRVQPRLRRAAPGRLDGPLARASLAEPDPPPRPVRLAVVLAGRVRVGQAGPDQPVQHEARQPARRGRDHGAGRPDLERDLRDGRHRPDPARPAERRHARSDARPAVD